MEAESLVQMKAVFKADRQKALHCGNSCCEDSRLIFNSNEKFEYQVEAVHETVRIVATPTGRIGTNSERDGKTGETGKGVVFLYYTRNSERFIVRRTYPSNPSNPSNPPPTTNDSNDSNDSYKEAYSYVMLTNDIFPDLQNELIRISALEASPCGNYLILDVYMPGTDKVRGFVWAVEKNAIREIHLHTNQSTSDKIGTPSMIPAEHTSIYRAWWARDVQSDGTCSTHMFVGWCFSPPLLAYPPSVQPDTEHTGQSRDGNVGFAVLEYDFQEYDIKNPNAPLVEFTVRLPFYRSNAVRIFFQSFYAIVFALHRSRTYLCSVLNFKEAPQTNQPNQPQFHIATVSAVSATERPNSNHIRGSPFHEQFYKPAHACLSDDGTRLAVLAHQCKHLHGSKPNNGVINEDHLVLVLFTLSEDNSYFYRKNGARDEAFIPFHSAIQNPVDFELGFSGCESMLTVIYTMNRYNVPPAPSQSIFPSLVVIVVNPSNLKRSRAISTTKVRNVLFCAKSVFLVARHGCVVFTPK
jgi:hypothetical protein